ncbi:hypothetical protein B0J13DRAFT_605158 [Dactylonectria estremocensis]|uniref:Uncharacterized protein n=1 Tax=Dactylonectria estremocensis TaxID=1079267 RepID=A0A9P9J5Q7_9HYPO|nr:hypothetical protein B0J13DRAFT_605158 [Dactylonectria estremocensis]
MAPPETTSPANGSQQNETFKDQLDKAAAERRANLGNQKPNPIVEKITEYIPAATKILGSQQSDPKESGTSNVPGPPERPDHDDIIEGFVREQHRSNGDDGLLNGKDA